MSDRTSSDGCPQGMTEADMRKIVVAYEPVWPSYGKTAHQSKLRDSYIDSSKVLALYTHDVAETLRIQYGGV